MIEKKIRSLRDYNLKTYFGNHYLSKGEVVRVRFKNHQTFESQVALGNVVEAGRDEPEAKNLPIILPEEDTQPTDLAAPKSDEDVEETPIEEQLSNLPESKETPGEPTEEVVSKLGGDRED